LVTRCSSLTYQVKRFRRFRSFLWRFREILLIDQQMDLIGGDVPLCNFVFKLRCTVVIEVG